MKTWTVAAALLFVCTYGFAQTEQAAPARKPCEDLKAEIAKKLDAKGVTAYTLDVVEKGKEGDAKVVGGCDGATKSSRGLTKASALHKPASPAVRTSVLPHDPRIWADPFSRAARNAARRDGLPARHHPYIARR